MCNVKNARDERVLAVNQVPEKILVASDSTHHVACWHPVGVCAELRSSSVHLRLVLSPARACDL